MALSFIPMLSVVLLLLACSLCAAAPVAVNRPLDSFKLPASKAAQRQRDAVQADGELPQFDKIGRVFVMGVSSGG